MASHLIGQRPVSTFVTPVAGTSPIDANVVRSNDNTTGSTYTGHDADGTIHVQDSILGSRAAAGTAGRKWLTTDASAFYLFYDDGSAWNEISYARTASPSFTGAVTITSSSANALAVGLNGVTNPAFNVDSSTALQVAGLNVIGAVTGGTVAVVVTDSGSNANLTINAKGSGTIGIGSVSTGRVTITPVTTITGALTLSATLGAAAANFSGNVVVNSTITLASTGAVSGITTLAGTGGVSGFTTMAFSGNLAINTNKFVVTATTGAFSAGAFTSSVGNGGTVISSPANATTGAISFIDGQNTGGRSTYGLESSTGGSNTTGSTAYAVTLVSFGSALELGANNTVYLGIVGAAGTPTNSSVGNLYVRNASAPTGTPTGMYYLWAESGALKGRGTSGTNTTIGAAEPHCPVCGADFGLEWENEKYGGRLHICMKCLVNDLAPNKPYIHYTA